MPDQELIDYYLMREVKEREAVMSCSSPAVADVHRELADLYKDRVIAELGKARWGRPSWLRSKDKPVHSQGGISSRIVDTILPAVSAQALLRQS